MTFALTKLKLSSIMSHSAWAQLDGCVLYRLVGNDQVEIHWEAGDRSTLQLGISLTNDNLRWFRLSLQQHVLWPKSSRNYATEVYLKLLKWLHIGRTCSSIWCAFKKPVFSWITLEMHFRNRSLLFLVPWWERGGCSVNLKVAGLFILLAFREV